MGFIGIKKTKSSWNIFQIKNYVKRMKKIIRFLKYYENSMVTLIAIFINLHACFWKVDISDLLTQRIFPHNPRQKMIMLTPAPLRESSKSKLFYFFTFFLLPRPVPLHLFRGAVKVMYWVAYLEVAWYFLRALLTDLINHHLEIEFTCLFTVSSQKKYQRGLKVSTKSQYS